MVEIIEFVHDQDQRRVILEFERIRLEGHGFAEDRGNTIGQTLQLRCLLFRVSLQRTRFLSTKVWGSFFKSLLRQSQAKLGRRRVAQRLAPRWSAPWLASWTRRLVEIGAVNDANTAERLQRDRFRQLSRRNLCNLRTHFVSLFQCHRARCPTSHSETPWPIRLNALSSSGFGKPVLFPTNLMRGVSAYDAQCGNICQNQFESTDACDSTTKRAPFFASSITLSIHGCIGSNGGVPDTPPTVVRLLHSRIV